MTLRASAKQAILELVFSHSFRSVADVNPKAEMLARGVHYPRRANRSLIADNLPNSRHAGFRVRDSVRNHSSGGVREFL